MYFFFLLLFCSFLSISQVANVLYVDQINVYVMLEEIIMMATDNSGLSWDTNGESATDWNQKPNNPVFR